MYTGSDECQDGNDNSELCGAGGGSRGFRIRGRGDYKGGKISSGAPPLHFLNRTALTQISEIGYIAAWQSL